MKECFDCVFYQSCCGHCCAKADSALDAESCDYFLTVESAKYYATVKNGIYKALGDPIDFGRKVASSLKESTSKAAEIHDRD